RDGSSGAERGTEDPRHEIAPVIEVEVGDRDRIDTRPAAVELADAGEDSRPAIEKQPPLALDEIARLGAAGVRPCRGAPDYRELHPPYPADFSRTSTRCITPPWPGHRPTSSSRCLSSRGSTSASSSRSPARCASGASAPATR